MCWMCLEPPAMSLAMAAGGDHFGFARRFPFSCATRMPSTESIAP